MAQSEVSENECLSVCATGVIRVCDVMSLAVCVGVSTTTKFVMSEFYCLVDMKNVKRKMEEREEGCESKRAREEDEKAVVTREEDEKTREEPTEKERMAADWENGVKSAITFLRSGEGDDIDDQYALADVITSFLDETFTGNTYDTVLNCLQGEGRELTDYDAIQADIIGEFENYEDDEYEESESESECDSSDSE